MRHTSPLPRRSSNKAAALIIVLAFVVLLTGLSVAYLSRSTTDRQLAHSSFNDTSADLLARSALDIVIGDFKQEIINGSTSPAPVIDGTTIYIPKASQRNIVATRSGHPNPTPADETTDPIPNLIRRSIRSDPIVAPGVASRASAVNSTTDPSSNGRSITTTRWNSHYLIPKGDTTTTDSSPVPSFTPPDWVIVTRAGPTPCATFPPDGRLADSTNGNYAIGRYAYAVYDEGGLLDINVAGYPSPTPAALPPSAPSGRDVGRKGVLAFADLTALPTTPGNFMTATDINTLVGFRNYATMQLSGVSGLNFSLFSDAAVSNFFTYFTMPSPSPASSPRQLGTTKDFGVVNTAIASDGRTDQSFITRAELINFVKSTNIFSTGIVNTLQYLGTFSREQNKPNFQLTTMPTGFTRRVLPQRFYLGNLNEVVNPGNAANIQRYFGLRFASSGGSGSCANQLRWKYVGQDANPNATPRPDISPFPSDLTTLDFFQYINYALFGRTDSDSTHCARTLEIGASIIDQYDNDTSSTGIYFNPGSAPYGCDDSLASSCITFGADAGSAGPSGTPLPCVTGVSTTYSPSGVFLNRPLRSVGEFSYAYNLNNAIIGNNGPTYYLNNFRDVWKSTNPDPGLLDFFTYNKASVRSGIVSLNTRQPRVLAALLKGAIYNNTSSSVVNDSDAITAANSIVKLNYGGFYSLSRADIANLSRKPGAGQPGVNNTPFTNDDPPAGAQTWEARETIARALSEVVQTRTWGLLIDLVAQTGHYKPNVDPTYCNTHNCLGDQFVVEGEKRYWLHIAIDRFDGTIVGQQLEEVTE
jgi:hypothetical protein